jgi:predicted peroxiredoxin
MAKYLLIESRDPFDSNDTGRYYELAAALAREGNAVTFFLVQNGVLPARSGVRSDALYQIKEAGVEVLADDFSLRERGIPPDKLAAGVQAAPLEIVIDQLADGCKAMWH